jgi:integrase
MPATDHQAVLEVSDVGLVMNEARRTGVLAFALTAWMYEFGARGAEPGLQLLSDLDLKRSVARPAHLKKGKSQVWHRLLPFCRDALPAWLKARTVFLGDYGVIKVADRGLYLFPTSIETGRCYTCAGSGKRPVLKREGKKRFKDGTEPCHHCNETGVRWGIDRREVYEIVRGVLKRAGMPDGRQHPHVLRHSIITHMLEGGAPPAMVQDRVGHRSQTTTLEYARTTQAAIDELEGRMSKVYRRDKEDEES